MSTTEQILEQLIDKISKLGEVQSIGLSGSKTPLPKVGEGDIDLFIYCDHIPSSFDREKIFHHSKDLLTQCKINVFEGGHWGVGDFVLINGIETWLMYFTLDHTLNDVEKIIKGEYPDKLDNYYYPIGRLAMLKNMTILYDKNCFLVSLKNRLSIYPEDLSTTLIQYHLDELKDTEDLERAVVRKDVLFYHFALDLSLDHFLQAVFAMNKVYFPSRKRSLDFIHNFNLKPKQCHEKLLEVIKLGSSEEGIKSSYEIWSHLVNELNHLYNEIN